MATRLPDVTALGERPTPKPGDGVSTYRPNTGSEELAGATQAKFGEMVTAFAEKQQDQLDTQRAEDAFNQIRNAATDLTVGEKGFANVKGADAVKTPMVEDFSRRFADANNAIESTLGNEHQKRLYRQRYSVAQAQFNDHLLRHRVQEGNVYAEQVFDGTVATEMRNIGIQYLDPNAVNASITRMVAAAGTIGEKRGEDKDRLDERKAKIVDAALATRFTSWMYTDPVGAMKAFKENADKISNPELRLTLEHKLKATAIPLEVKGAAATIMGPSGEADVRAVVTNSPALAANPALLQASMRVSDADQIKRDQDALLIAKRESQDNPNDPNAQRRVVDLETRLAAGTPWAEGDAFRKGGTQRTAAASGTPTPAPQAVADTRAMLATYLSRAEAEAQRTHPNDPVYRDALITEIKSKVNTIVAAQAGLSQQAHSQITAMVMPGPGKAGATDLTQITGTPEGARAWQLLTPESQRGVLAMLESNSRSSDRPNPKVSNELFRRIHLPENDPLKIRDLTQITPSIAELGREGYGFLKKEIDEQGSAGGRSFTADLQNVRNTGKNMLTRSIMGSVQPDLAEEAAYRFTMDLNQKVEQYRKEGKDPRLLLTPGTKEYALDPAKIQSFMTPGAQVIADEAQKVVAAGQAQGTIPPTESMVKLDKANPQASFDALAPGTWFVTADGKRGRKPPAAAAGEGQGSGAPAAQPGAAVAAPGADIGPTLTNAAKLAAEGPKVPELVEETGGRRGAKADPEKARAQFGEAGASYMSAMTAPLRLRAAAQGAVIRALTPDDALASAKSFRQMVKTGKYTVASEQIIGDAIASGILSDQEKQVAQTMLERIDAKKKR